MFRLKSLNTIIQKEWTMRYLSSNIFTIWFSECDRSMDCPKEADLQPDPSPIRRKNTSVKWRIRCLFLINATSASIIEDGCFWVLEINWIGSNLKKKSIVNLFALQGVIRFALEFIQYYHFVPLVICRKCIFNVHL